jgi:hypothetical protein
VVNRPSERRLLKLTLILRSGEEVDKVGEFRRRARFLAVRDDGVIVDGWDDETAAATRESSRSGTIPIWLNLCASKHRSARGRRFAQRHRPLYPRIANGA